MENETSLLNDLYDDAAWVFHSTPFLARNDPRDFLALKQWLATLVVLDNMQVLAGELAQRLLRATTYGHQILQLQSYGQIERSEQLIALLALRQHGLHLSQYLTELIENTTLNRVAIPPLTGAVIEDARRRAEITARFCLDYPFQTHPGE